MSTEELVHTWFKKWETGDFLNLPLTDQFKHTSPYGTIMGKEYYLNLVKANQDKFLNHRFEIHDEIFGDNKACIRYTAIQGNFSLEVSEWFFTKDSLIDEICSYYTMEGTISEDRKIDI
ncbi:nuclear transport factor 2 family protein [Mangrovimonas aestuarii]|uniref:nuclear transport factor 2 family protein n=1 Tax=Mangrovimonas aestuarii TaxID=3018443 RepID=UPI0023790C90|nr:nuclear transport factor 2 family protein [Mangrovimonas aestuarii]